MSVSMTCPHCRREWMSGDLLVGPGPLPNGDLWDPSCPHCGRPLATLNTHRIPGWRLELLRDEHARNQRGGW